MKEIKCKDCWRNQTCWRSTVPEYAKQGCKKGIDNQILSEALLEVIDIKKEKAQQNVFHLEMLNQQANDLAAAVHCQKTILKGNWISAFGKFESCITLPVDPEKGNEMSSFLCENCCEAVMVPISQLRQELRFKCPVCHQYNHYDLTVMLS